MLCGPMFFAAVEVGDPADSLLLHGEGVDSGTVFVDSSPYAHVMTGHGSAVTSTAQKKFGASSIHLNGSTDYLTTPAGATFNFGSGDWTVEAFFRLTSAPSPEASIVCFNNDDASSVLDFRIDSFQRCICQCYWTAGGGVVLQHTDLYVVSLDTWHHMAFVRNGNTVSAYFNGVSFGGTGDATGKTMHSPSDPIKIGRRPQGSSTFSHFPGYIDEVRISKGVARYTANFTPPSAPF